MSFQEFFAMNGFAGYVWGSYGIALVTFLIMFLSVRAQRKTLVNQLRRRYRLQKERQFKERQNKERQNKERSPEK